MSMSNKTKPYITSRPKNNPWAIATASVGRKDNAKYERAVKEIKKKIGYHK